MQAVNASSLVENMFTVESTRRNEDDSTMAEHSQPLLGSRRERRGDEGHTIFSIQDSDDELEGTALDSAKTDRTDHSVRFREEVQVIGPPLRSTLASREAGMYVSLSCSGLHFGFAH